MDGQGYQMSHHPTAISALISDCILICTFWEYRHVYIQHLWNFSPTHIYGVYGSYSGWLNSCESLDYWQVCIANARGKDQTKNLMVTLCPFSLINFGSWLWYYLWQHTHATALLPSPYTKHPAAPISQRTIFLLLDRASRISSQIPFWPWTEERLL